MNAKVFLSQARKVELQVESKLQQLEALKSLATRVTVSYDSTPVTHTKNTSALPDAVIRIMEAEEELNRKIDDLVAVKLEIADVIDRVEDVTLRLLLEKRYLGFMKMEDVAGELGYTKRWLWVLHGRALRVVQGILDTMAA